MYRFSLNVSSFFLRNIFLFHFLRFNFISLFRFLNRTRNLQLIPYFLSFCLVTRRIILFGSCLHSITITRDEQSSFTTRLVRFDIQPSTFSANPNVKIGLLFNASACAFFKFLFFPSFFYFRMPHSISLQINYLYKYLHVPSLRVTSVQYSFFLFFFFFSSSLIVTGFRNQKSRNDLQSFLLYAIIGMIRHLRIISRISLV